MIDEIKYWWKETTHVRNFFIVEGWIVAVVLSLSRVSPSNQLYVETVPWLFTLCFGALSGLFAYIFLFWICGGVFVLLGHLTLKIGLVKSMTPAEHNKYCRDYGRLLGEL